MWQFAESPVSIAVLESFYNTGKPIARVCHSLGGFRHATYQGAPPRCLLSVDTGIVPSSVSVTSVEVIHSSYWPVESRASTTQQSN